MIVPNKLLKTITIFLSIGMVVLVVIYGVLPKLVQKDTESREISENVADESVAGTAPVLVEAQPARRAQLVMRISATGLAEAIRQVVITPKVGGDIVELPIYEGKPVKKGELLMKLDDREYQLALAQAKDALLKAQYEYGQRKFGVGLREQGTKGAAVQKSRGEGSYGNSGELEKVILEWESAQERYRKGEISESEYQKAKLNFEIAQVLAGEKREELIANTTGLSKALIDVKRAELNLLYTEIRAPFSGLIGNLEVEKGQRVSPGQECFTLVDLSQLKVEVGVLESEIGFMKVGRKATVTFPAFPGEEFEGQVVSINPIVDSETKTCRVTVQLDNPGGKLKSGMFAFVKLEAQIFENRFLVPKEAILIRDQRKLVFVIRDNLAKWCYVDTGLENEDFVEITGSTLGLKEGELVIVSGHYTLTHDAPVRVVNGN